MASKPWLTHQAALISLLILWRDSVICTGLAVDPPEDLVILDHGHLGRLELTWSPPASLVDVPDCLLRYQLEYFNTYWDSWSAIRTSSRSYSAQFDLMKDVRVRVYTLLSGPCTNGTLIKSTKYTEVVQKPSSTGEAVQDVICVFHNMEYMECKWGRNPKILASSQLNLYFWHKELEHAEECPKYIISDGVRSGCDFTETSLPDFTDINLCVNGSSFDGPLKPTFMSLQTQNQVKPGTTDKLYLHTNPDMQLEIQWECPVGGVPEDCLEWEVEHNQEGSDGRMTLQQILTTKETSITLASNHENERSCFRVRSKLHKYCVDKSFWSEWSQPICHPAFQMKKDAPEPEWGMVPVYVYIAVAVIIMLMLSLCVWGVLKVRSRQEKKPDSLLTTLFARSSVLTVAEA
ncbi:interleukin-13 receptor subunit alpha-2 isoform X2 [Anabas testudineus]|uniref:interleukin-13 receptor subunit alpha-2 isoform X2 n=1 Tax=Anabas testudineus TaxID=64144 RepID=UPI000E45CDBF|nr:interleukin-13 receptor subunit alpha-2 isoform X2 [Anabas testudineus]